MKRIRLFTILAVMLLFALPLSAQNLGLQRLSGKVGIIFPKDAGTGFMLGAAADMGELTKDLSLIPLISYWSSSKDESGINVSLSNIQIGADVQYYLKDVKGMYVGGGLSLNFATVTAETNIFGSTYSADASETKIGIGILAGYELPVGNNIGFVNAKYHLISDINTFAINIGMWFDMK